MSRKTLLQTITFTIPHIQLFYLLTLIAPLLFDHSQLLLGSIVNFILVGAALSGLSLKKTAPLVFLPSLITLVKGYLFGPFTPLILYMLPFIWLGNAVFIFILRSGNSGGKVIMGHIFVGAVVKSAIIFGAANIWIALELLPEIFKITMGGMQLATAIIGGLGALIYVSFSGLREENRV